MGLFLNGGDLLYRNRRAANQEGHSILQEGVKGIGGHHLVLLIETLEFSYLHFQIIFILF
jgi:hypothetical protein